MQIFDKTCSRYYVQKVDTFRHNWEDYYGGVIIIPDGKNFDGIFYSPFKGTFYRDGQIGTDDNGTYYVSNWYSSQITNGTTSYIPKRYDTINVGDMLGYFTNNMWALYICTPIRSDVAKIHDMFPVDGWVENTDYAQKGKAVVVSMDTVTESGVTAKVNRAIYNIGDAVDPEHKESKTGLEWVGWSTTWPNYTPYSGIAEEGVQYLYGNWNGEKEEVQIVFDTGDNSLINNQEKYAATVEIVSGTKPVPMCLPYVDFDMGKYFNFLELGGVGYGTVFGTSYKKNSMSPIFTINPDTVNIKDLFEFKLRIFTDFKSGKYEIYTMEETPYPESVDLLFSYPSANGLSYGNDMWKISTGCYWYYSGRYKKAVDTWMPLMLMYDDPFIY